MTLRLASTLLGLLFTGFLFGQTRWTEAKDLSDSLRKSPRAIVVFIHTDWCKYCKMQEKSTFADKKVATKLNKDFYVIKLNAESKENLTFLGRQYKGRVESRYHELAEYLGTVNGKITFPTTVVMSPQLKIQQQRAGYVSKKEIPDLLSPNPGKD